MKKITLFILATAACALFAGCGAPATNTGNANANANANAVKPAAAPPTKDALFAMDKQANEAFIKGDGKFFEGFLSDKFVSYDHGQRTGKAEIVKMINETKCDVKTWSLEDAQMAMIDADTAVVTYKGTFEGTCGDQKLPSPVRAASVYVRSGDKWLGAFHSETLIIDPKAPPAPPAKADKKEAPAEKPAANAKPADTKSADTKATETNTADTKAADTKATGDANTEALVKLQTAGWEAWKAKDAKKLEELTAKDLSFVAPDGSWLAGKADVVKAWTTMDCEGVTKVSFTEGFASALSPTVEILTGKGTADGTCFGQKNGDLYQSAVYVKEGDAWKLAFMFESPA